MHYFVIINHNKTQITRNCNKLSSHVTLEATLYNNVGASDIILSILYHAVCFKTFQCCHLIICKSHLPLFYT